MGTEFLIDLLRRWGEFDLAGIAALSAVFIVSGLVPVPRTPLCIAAGLIFGMQAMAVIVPATTLSGVIAFILARYFVFDWVRRSLQGRTRLQTLMEAIDAEEWKILALLRFAGPLPVVAVNYLFGLTRMTLLSYTVTSFVFAIPQIWLYVYIGALGRAAILGDVGSRINFIAGIVGAVTMIAVFIIITRKVRAAFRPAATEAE